MGFIEVEFAEDLINIGRLWQFNGSLLSVLLYFEAKVEVDGAHVNHRKSRDEFYLNIFYYSAVFWSHWFDVINKGTNHGAVQACFGPKDAMICINFCQAKPLEEEVCEFFVPETGRLFEAI